MLYIIIIHPFHYKKFKYPSTALSLRSCPKQPIRQEISWQCMCHQQSLTRSDLHPQEPLPLINHKDKQGKPQHIILCLEDRQTDSHLTSMEDCLHTLTLLYVLSVPEDLLVFWISYSHLLHYTYNFFTCLLHIQFLQPFNNRITYIFSIHRRPTNSYLMWV